jgi:hypothetical protein
MQNFEFKSDIFIYPGEAGWHFLTVPTETASVISERFSDLKKGFGSLKVNVTIGNSTWPTSIFPDRKSGTYLLPLKASIRKAEGLKPGQKVNKVILNIIV